MPRHDPLPDPNKPRALSLPYDTPEQEIEFLQDALRYAERMLKALGAERDALRRQLLQAGLRPKSGKRKPPEAGLSIPAVPPRGPLPLQGGAEAPLESGE